MGVAARRMPCGFSNGNPDPFDNCVAYHSRQPPSQAVSGDRGVEAQPGNDAVDLPGHAGDADDQQHPGQNGHTAGDIPQNRYEEF